VFTISIPHQARRGDLEISLSNREFALLEFLMVSSPRPVSKTAIVEHVWDQNFDSQTNVVNVYVKYLRSKIDLSGYKPLIHTVRGIGFVEFRSFAQVVRMFESYDLRLFFAVGWLVKEDPANPELGRIAGMLQQWDGSKRPVQRRINSADQRL
jgi:hypothetical protein